MRRWDNQAPPVARPDVAARANRRAGFKKAGNLPYRGMPLNTWASVARALPRGAGRAAAASKPSAVPAAAGLAGGRIRRVDGSR